MLLNLEAKKSKIQQLLTDAYELRSHNLSGSITTAQNALELSREIEIPELIGKSLNKLALFSMIQGENQKSLEMSQEAIQYFIQLNDEQGIADSKYNIAGIHYKTNNFYLGMVYLLDCLMIYRKHKDYHNESRTQKSLGTIYEYFDDIDSAKSAYEGAIEAAKRAENRNLKTNAYNNFSGLLLKLNEVEKANQMIDDSIKIKTETGDKRGIGFALYGKGKVLTHLKEYEEAEQKYFEALEIHKSFGDNVGIVMTYHKIGVLWDKMGKIKEAKQILKKGEKISRKSNNVLFNVKINYSLYQIYQEEGKNKKAIKYLENYIEMKQSVTNSQTNKLRENYELISNQKSSERDGKIKQEKAKMMLEQERSKESAQMKQEFLSAMSHEIRTPLNAVTTIIALLEDRTDNAEKELLTSLRFSSKNLLRIIDDILDFSKLDSNNMKLDEHPVKFKILLNNIKKSYAYMAREKGLILEIKIIGKIADNYTLDETKFFQILGNLLSNAIKYTNTGKIKLIVELIKVEKSKHQLRFVVEDTGVGIPDSEMNQLFESFYMPTSITTRAIGGTGLGLAIVKKLIGLHNSVIKIESEVGKGSKFCFDLVLCTSEAPLKHTLEIYSSLKNKTAILAEDNEINAMVMSRLLQKWGVVIKRAKNGIHAVEMAKENEVDFILMDIHMPLMNGFEAAKKIKTLKNRNQSCPIFALTADVTANNNDGYQEYFSGFLNKPIQMDRLLSALTNNLRPEVIE